MTVTEISCDWRGVYTVNIPSYRICEYYYHQVVWSPALCFGGDNMQYRKALDDYMYAASDLLCVSLLANIFLFSFSLHTTKRNASL
jgi:hypothetical protein